MSVIREKAGMAAAGRFGVMFILALTVPALLARPVAVQTATGFAVIGDSASDEYRADDNRGGAYAATTFNWLELLVRYRGLNVGPWGSRAEPRRTGYAYNWARSGAVAAEIGIQAAGVAQQVSSGAVSTVMVLIGGNDFALWNNTYAEIYDGTLSDAAVAAKVDAIVGHITAAVATVQEAGPVTVFVSTLPERASAPSFQAAFPDPVKRQRVTNAIVAVNTRLQTLAPQNGFLIVDMYGLGTVILARIGADGLLHVGSEAISLTTVGDEPHHVVLADNEHVGTVASGLFANLVIEGLNTAGWTVAPFTDQEITANAGIVPPDTTAPIISLTSPTNQAVVSGSVTVTANATDNRGIAGVQFKLDGANLGTEDTAAPYSRSWTTGIPQNGTHTLTAVARDAAGNTSTAAAVTVTVNNVDATKPTVSLTAPASGAQIVGNLTVSASASDNVGVAGVTFLMDGVAIGPEDTASPYSTTVATSVAQNGTHTLTARARDAAGNQQTSSSRSITIANPVPDTTFPIVSISSPSAGATVAAVVTVSASATDNKGVVGVSFRLDGVSLGAEDKTAPYSVSWNTTTTANGSHVLTASARDAAGNTSTATATVTVANPSAETLVPASYVVTDGAYVSGTVAGAAANDDAYLAVRGTLSSFTYYTRTDFDFINAPSSLSRIDITMIAKSTTSTTVRVYAYNVTTASWTQLSSATIGTGESTLTASVLSGASAYRDAGGRVRLRVMGSRLFGNFTLSHEVVTIRVN
jgi:hypothetical protein